MYLDRISAATPDARLVTRDSVAQSQWEAVLSEQELKSTATAWPSRPLVTQSYWLTSCWESAQATGLINRSRLLLTASQSDRLWQRVIDASPEGKALISSGGVSTWARAARRSLFDCGLAPGRQRGREWQDDAAAFLRWNADFEHELAANGWVDTDSLAFEINQLPASGIGHDLIWLDPRQATVEIGRLDKNWRAAGFSIDSIEPDGQRATTTTLIAGDPGEELDLAADWAHNRLGVNAGIRLAIVLPDLDARRDEVERTIVDRVGAERVMSTTTQSISSVGVFGAALAAIELLSGSGEFGQLSRWLRSPFFASGDDSCVRHRAQLEITLRRDPRSQQPLADAWHRQGLRTAFERKLPDTSRRIDAALARLPRRATPTAWTGVWQACLDNLGWLGFELSMPDAMQSAWDNVWAAFSELTPILGTVEPGIALDALRQIASQRSIYEPIPLCGVHLFDRIDHIGPGFSGAWIGGFSDENFPEPNIANPLLPWSVQAAHGMPGASPDSALTASREELDRLLRRVPEAVFSCPRRTLDQPLLPSPLMSGWSPAPVSAEIYAGAAAKRIGARGWQKRIDPAPPLAGNVVPGGTRTLELQAKSPAKAFCIARLRAEPLETPARGVDPRLKGLLIHRALELLLKPAGAVAGDTRLVDAVATAIREYVKPGDTVWEAQVRAEAARIEALLTKFCDIEASREPFTTVAVERKTEIDFDAHRLRCRIDRIDRLDAGGEILIDYKTGQSVGGRWFDDRLSECQLPVYAQCVAEVTGIATIRLQGNEVEYRGAGRNALSLPGKVRTFEDPAWDAVLVRWREQLKTLLDEFSGGDTRVRSDAAQHVDSDAMEHVGGAFAPLTRVGDDA